MIDSNYLKARADGLAKGMYWLRLQHSPQPVKLIIH